jgi:hypothetical protein
MKSDLTFLLDHAPWPAFVVDSSGTIRKTNAQAVQVLGTVMEGESALSASIWAAENEQSAEEFLSRVDLSSNPMRLLHFRIKGGHTTRFRAYVCAFSRTGCKSHLFQLFPDAVPSHETAGSPLDPSMFTHEGAAWQ